MSSQRGDIRLVNEVTPYARTGEWNEIHVPVVDSWIETHQLLRHIFGHGELPHLK